MKIKKIFTFLLSTVLSVGMLSSCKDNFVPPEYTPPEKDNSPVYATASENLYTATINSIVSTDSLGRSFGESDLKSADKKVGMF